MHFLKQPLPYNPLFPSMSIELLKQLRGVRVNILEAPEAPSLFVVSPAMHEQLLRRECFAQVAPRYFERRNKNLVLKPKTFNIHSHSSPVPACTYFCSFCHIASPNLT